MNDLSGSVFGRWKVVEFSHTALQGNNYRTYWKCKCECGNEKTVRGDILKCGRSQSCGCLHKEASKKQALKMSVANRKYSLEESTLKTHYNKHVDRAKGLNIENKEPLPYDEWLSIVRQPCFYCRKPGTQKNSSSGATILFNGVDRVDSNIGYIKSNSIPCCGICNTSKMDTPQKEFLENVRQIADIHDPFNQYLEAIASCYGRSA